MSFVRPMSLKTESMVGRAEVVHCSNQVGLSTIEITDPDGRMLAFGSTRCLISDVPVDPGAEYPPPDLGPTEPPESLAAAGAGRWLLQPRRDPRRASLRPAAAHRRRRSRLPGLAADRLPPQLVAHGQVTGVLPASAWLSNGGPAVYGGLIAWAAEFTMGAAVYSMLGAGDVFATLDLHIRFTRPARIDVGGLTFRASVDHSGKRLRVTSCTVDDAEGKRVAMATSSALLVPGGVRELTKGRLPDEILADAERNERA